MKDDVRRTELLAELDRLTAEEGALRAQRALTSYRLEQTLRERHRVQRDLASLARGGNTEEGGAWSA